MDAHHGEAKAMTQGEARKQCRALGFALRVRDGEISILRYGAADAESRYFAADLSDAVGTARAIEAMARDTARREAERSARALLVSLYGPEASPWA